MFYGDYYGIPHDNIAPVKDLKKLIKLRECCAYGEQIDYFDDPSMVGFVRTGDEEHLHSGMIVLITDSVAGTKRMHVHEKFAGAKFYDVLGHFSEPIVLDTEACGKFKVDGGSVSVWVTEEMYQKIYTEID